MKLVRKLKASTGYLKVDVQINIEARPDFYTSSQSKEKRKKLVEGIYDLLRNSLGFEIEQIVLK